MFPIPNGHGTIKYPLRQSSFWVNYCVIFRQGYRKVTKTSLDYRKVTKTSLDYRKVTKTSLDYRKVTKTSLDYRKVTCL